MFSPQPHGLWLLLSAHLCMFHLFRRDHKAGRDRYGHSRATTKAQAIGWNKPATLEYFGRVDKLRNKLKRPEGKPVRSITTATGEVIETKAEGKCFAGTLLSYYAQGTIAGIINRAALHIIDLESEKGWRFVIPCHDSVYVLAPPEQIPELEQIVLSEGAKTGFDLYLKLNITQPKNR